MSKITAWEQIKTQMDAGKTVELQQAIAVFREASSNEDGYYSENDHLAELEQLFLIPDLQWTGPSASFHNLAVSFSRADKNRSACNVLERGLAMYPASVDLLADYLKYGTEDGRWEVCSKCYDTLQSLGMDSWNWRAYSFSIDYLLEMRERTLCSVERDGLRSKVLDLAKRFVAKQKSDLAYFDLANVHRMLNEKTAEETILKRATDSNHFFPRCSLRLADIAISRGDYPLALKRLKVCQVALKPQADINPSYVYGLNALCKSSLLIGQILEDEGEFKVYRPQAESIYKDYNTAVAIGLDEIMKKTLQAVVAVIENQTGVKNSVGQIDASDF